MSGEVSGRASVRISVRISVRGSVRISVRKGWGDVVMTQLTVCCGAAAGR